MDLISREKALADDGLAEFHRYDDYSKMREYLKSLPSAFEGMTNGEVIQALFPKAKIFENESNTEYIYVDVFLCTEYDMNCFTKEWWNAPYQKGGE